ncbi:MAG TPA: hypothetical protein VF846_15820 [Thermoanaerobaculia bacterium]|jgi:hypothetical protein
MATIDQPTPSSPKSPQPEIQPLQPGGPQTSRDNSPSSQRPNYQTPDSQKDKIRDENR